jgi:hypothetical protein
VDVSLLWLHPDLLYLREIKAPTITPATTNQGVTVSEGSCFQGYRQRSLPGYGGGQVCPAESARQDRGDHVMITRLASKALSAGGHRVNLAASYKNGE